jgi:hypothetical protein
MATKYIGCFPSLALAKREPSDTSKERKGVSADMFKGASKNAQSRRDRGLASSSPARPMLKKERQRAAKRAKKWAKMGPMARIKATWDE